jgi:uncharacterized protein (TIGR02646 family)
MIARRFVPPNFTVVATDEDGHQRKWVTRGDSEDDVRRHLEAEDWTVESIAPYDFCTWLNRSAELLAKILEDKEAGLKLAFSREHWGVLKKHLFELFAGKCAYCEAFALHVTSGDVEHYRPKARVDGEPDHPGYYWLAYDPQNLLPACEMCNRARGKMNQFPVESGTRANDPAGVPAERPLLLNPYLDAPQLHIRFAKTGHVEGCTEKGKVSVIVYRLKRGELRRKREACFDDMARDLDANSFRNGLQAAVDDMLEDLRTGEREYSAALLSCLPRWLDERESEAAAVKANLAAKINGESAETGRSSTLRSA